MVQVCVVEELIEVCMVAIGMNQEHRTRAKHRSAEDQMNITLNNVNHKYHESGRNPQTSRPYRWHASERHTTDR